MIDIFWIMPYDLENEHLENMTIFREKFVKNFILDPKNNEKIENIYLLVPFDPEDDKHYNGLQFLLTKVFNRKTDINYPRIRSIIENNSKYLKSIVKKDFLDVYINKRHSDEIVKIDDTYYEGEEKEKNNIINENTPKNKIEDKNDSIKKEQVLTNDPSQLDITTQDQLKLDYMKNKYNTEILNMMEDRKSVV